MLTTIPPSYADASRSRSLRKSLFRDPDAVIVGTSLVGLTALAWLALTWPSDGTPFDGAGLLSSVGQAPSVEDTIRFLAGWAVVIAAVFIPGAIPMVVRHRVLGRRFTSSESAGSSTRLFATVYFAAWFGFGVLVLAAAVLLKGLTTVRPDTAGVERYAGAALLLAAGAWQFTRPRKECLRMLRQPTEFLLENWRSGFVGTIRMALMNAGLCFGCYWGLVVVLVVVGMMAPPMVAILAVIVIAEKLLPRSERTAQVVGVSLLTLGFFAAANPDVAGRVRDSLHF
jgi:predicted metal-binding membrane protein